MKENKSVYIHIPFCKSICSYCDFCKFFYNKKWIEDYLNALEKEILDKYLGEDITTIYIGGGTPSSLDKKELEKLFKIIKVFKTPNLKEFTFECNPSDITEELIDILVKNKVNRVSIGIESFDKNNLTFLKRESNFEDIKEKIDLLKKKGITNINVDLMYALPGETIKVLKNDLKQFMKLEVPHISTYSLMIEDHTYLSYKNTTPINEELDAKMYQTIINFLRKNKYTHYEVSNFSKTGFESNHNLVYWNNEEYYGFGAGASGYHEGFRYDNTKSLTKYISGEYTQVSNMLSKNDKMDYEIILGLRKMQGINVKEFHDKYGVNIQNKYNIKPLLEDEELIYEDGYIFINPDKIYIMNEILIKII